MIDLSKTCETIYFNIQFISHIYELLDWGTVYIVQELPIFLIVMESI
jgi:hypothetical protein